jgi:hypothetical protein
VSQPSVGDVVLVFAEPEHNNGADVAPAVVTRVWSDQCVNVRVLYDGPAVPPGHRQDWLTSVPLYESRAAAEAAHAGRWAHVDHEMPRFGAFWPARVPGPLTDVPPGAFIEAAYAGVSMNTTGTAAP